MKTSVIPRVKKLCIATQYLNVSLFKGWNLYCIGVWVLKTCSTWYLTLLPNDLSGKPWYEFSVFWKVRHLTVVLIVLLNINKHCALTYIAIRWHSQNYCKLVNLLKLTQWSLLEQGVHTFWLFVHFYSYGWSVWSVLVRWSHIWISGSYWMKSYHSCLRYPPESPLYLWLFLVSLQNLILHLAIGVSKDTLSV